MYLGKWHNCEVAVKSLNPSLFFSGGDLSSINRTAIIDLVKEADMLGSLRWVALRCAALCYAMLQCAVPWFSW